MRSASSEASADGQRFHAVVNIGTSPLKRAISLAPKESRALWKITFCVAQVQAV